MTHQAIPDTYREDGEYDDATRARKIAIGGYLAALRQRVICGRCWNTNERTLTFIRWLGPEEPVGTMEDCGRHQ